ncbi:MAG TPA: hypothetical protein VN802_04835 [Stellaceae bacterium]|nr:hypothetical protein [Stellaceae bacterium]
MNPNPMRLNKPNRGGPDTAPLNAARMPVFLRDLAIIVAGLLGIVALLRFLVALDG